MIYRYNYEIMLIVSDSWCYLICLKLQYRPKMNCARECYKCRDRCDQSMTDFYDWIGDPIMTLCSDCKERRERKDKLAADTLELLKSIQSFINKYDEQRSKTV